MAVYDRPTAEQCFEDLRRVGDLRCDGNRDDDPATMIHESTVKMWDLYTGGRGAGRGVFSAPNRKCTWCLSCSG